MGDDYPTSIMYVAWCLMTLATIGVGYLIGSVAKRWRIRKRIKRLWTKTDDELAFWEHEGKRDLMRAWWNKDKHEPYDGSTPR